MPVLCGIFITIYAVSFIAMYALKKCIFAPHIYEFYAGKQENFTNFSIIFAQQLAVSVYHRINNKFFLSFFILFYFFICRYSMFLHLRHYMRELCDYAGFTNNAENRIIA